jgi:hypothetical protein
VGKSRYFWNFDQLRKIYSTLELILQMPICALIAKKEPAHNGVFAQLASRTLPGKLW